MSLEDDTVADQIRCEMRKVRREMRGNIESIATQARQLTDWKYYIAQAPWLAVGLAAFAGYSAVPTRPKPVAEGIATDSNRTGDATAKRHVGFGSDARAGGNGLTGFAKRLIMAGLTRSAFNFVAGRVAEIVDSSTKSNRPTQKYASTNGRDTT